jgi:hypothetical protein
MQINFALTNGPQYFDYKPWNDEALEFQSPIASLQKLVVSVTDPHGVPFGINQLDNMSVDSIRLASSVDISGRINVSRSTLICITPAYQTYPQVQMRVGDRVSFYTPTLKLLEKSDAISRNNDKKSFIGELTGTTLPVLEVATYKLDPRTNTYVVSSNTITSTDSRVDYFNVFFIPNFTTLQANGSLVDKYPGAVDLPDYSILDIQGILGPGTKLPFLNVTQQPIYTFEMVVKTPDTAAIGGTVVN